MNLKIKIMELLTIKHLTEYLEILNFRLNFAKNNEGLAKEIDEIGLKISQILLLIEYHKSKTF